MKSGKFHKNPQVRDSSKVTTTESDARTESSELESPEGETMPTRPPSALRFIELTDEGSKIGGAFAHPFSLADLPTRPSRPASSFPPSNLDETAPDVTPLHSELRWMGLVQATNQSARRFPVLMRLDQNLAADTFVIEKQEIVIGRDAQSDIVLNDARMSRRHARILWENFQRQDESPICRLEDLHSRNGVVLNGTLVRTAQLCEGDRMLLGETIFGFYTKDKTFLNYTTRLMDMATTDSLTGLANRSIFHREATKAIDRSRRYNRPLCLAILDIDHFKRINDTHGHVMGDEVLRQLGAILGRSVRTSDSVGRLGGEEFGILMPETAVPEAEGVLQRLRASIAKAPVQSPPTSIPVTVSLGLAQLEDHHATWTDLYKEADALLYEAKSSGRNCLKANRPLAH